MVRRPTQQPVAAPEERPRRHGPVPGEEKKKTKKKKPRPKHLLLAPFTDKCWECKFGKYEKSHNNAYRCRAERGHSGPDWQDCRPT